MTDINAQTAQHLASFIERANRLLDEKAALQEDLKQVYLEAKACGFDAAAIKRIVSETRKDAAKMKEAVSITETYIAALGALNDSPLGDWARARNASMSAARVPAAVTGYNVWKERLDEAFPDQQESPGKQEGNSNEPTISINGGPEHPMSVVKEAVEQVKADKKARPKRRGKAKETA